MHETDHSNQRGIGNPIQTAVDGGEKRSAGAHSPAPVPGNKMYGSQIRKPRKCLQRPVLATVISMEDGAAVPYGPSEIRIYEKYIIEILGRPGLDGIPFIPPVRRCFE